MIIEVLEKVKGCFPQRTNGKDSDAFDLFLGEDITLQKGEIATARLGVAMKLPDGFVARVYSRSSAPVKMGITVANGLGFIDNVYQGNNDEWRGIIYAFKDITLKKGTRICQFEISLSQFATFWQKLRWLFSSKLELVKVCALKGRNRGGIGSTGQ